MANILLGVTGSVATIRADRVAAALGKLGDVRVVSTRAGRYFLSDEVLDSLAEREIPLLVDEDEWPGDYSLRDPVLHIELRKWADVLVIAPLDANTLAKAAGGLCDNLLTSVIRAWDHRRPVVAAPAMNTYMWENWPTGNQIRLLERELGWTFVSPVEKQLACQDIGMGAMADPATIAAAVANVLPAV